MTLARIRKEWRNNSKDLDIKEELRHEDVIPTALFNLTLEYVMTEVTIANPNKINIKSNNLID